VRAVMKGMGNCVMGIGMGEGPLKALTAAQRAVSNQLVEVNSMRGARSIVVNITGGPDLALAEASEATSFITRCADPEANVIYGIVTNENLRDAVRVTVIATGFDLGPSATALEQAAKRRGPIAAPPPPPMSNGATAGSHGGMAGFMRRMWKGRSAQA
jgi:cell division protein FtsZ